MLHVITLTTALLSLPALVLSIKRMVLEKSAMTIIFAIVCLTMTSTMMSAMFHADEFVRMIEIASQATSRQLDITLLALAALVGGVILVAMLYFTVSKASSYNYGKWFFLNIAVYLLCNLSMGVLGSIMMGASIDKCFFSVCCAEMGAVGLAWGLTYKEICVIINIYMEASLCLLATLYLTWTTIRYCVRRKSPVSLIMAIVINAYCVVCLIGFLWICHHYAMPLPDAFDTCVIELRKLARQYHTTYNVVNYMIFIIFFLAHVVINLIGSQLIKAHVKL